MIIGYFVQFFKDGDDCYDNYFNVYDDGQILPFDESVLRPPDKYPLYFVEGLSSSELISMKYYSFL